MGDCAYEGGTAVQEFPPLPLLASSDYDLEARVVPLREFVGPNVPMGGEGKKEKGGREGGRARRERKEAKGEENRGPGNEKPHEGGGEGKGGGQTEGK